MLLLQHKIIQTIQMDIGFQQLSAVCFHHAAFIQLLTPFPGIESIQPVIQLNKSRILPGNPVNLPPRIQGNGFGKQNLLRLSPGHRGPVGINIVRHRRKFLQHEPGVPISPPGGRHHQISQLHGPADGLSVSFRNGTVLFEKRTVQIDGRQFQVHIPTPFPSACFGQNCRYYSIKSANCQQRKVQLFAFPGRKNRIPAGKTAARRLRSPKSRRQCRRI